MSDQPTVDQMNEVIAVFEDMVPFDDDPEYGRVYYHKGDKFKINRYPIKDLKYHSSWDWLHGAWDKLRTKVWEDNDGEYPSEFCGMSDVWEKACFDGKIENAHKLIFDAIQWLNTQKEKQ